MRHDPRSIERVRRVLLAMLGDAPRQDGPGQVPLQPGEWAMLDAMARQHRLQPLLHGRLKAAGAAWQVPRDYAAAWEQAYRRSAIEALAAKGALIRVGRILDLAGIAYAALKGAWLAWHGYANPALRPMRDLDILVAPDRLGEAYRALVAHGFEELDGGPYSADTLALGRKHLPALRDRATAIHVELHSRLFEHVGPAMTDAFLLRSDDLLASRVRLPLEQAAIAYLPACETLLHLAVHSAYEHRFDNGPQVLHDVAAVLARQTIDWQRFWMLAAEGGWTRGCQLVLRLTERMLGPQPVAWGSGHAALPQDILDKAALLLLQDTALRRDLDVQLQLENLGALSRANIGQIFTRFFPGRHVIAAYAGLSPDRRSVWLHYPAWLATRLARTVQGSFDQRQRGEVVRARDIERWLGAAPMVPGDGIEPPTP